MLLVKVIKDSVIYKGDIKKLDTEFECDKAIAESLIERGFVVATALVVGEEPEAEAELVTGYMDAEQLKEYSYKDLQKLAKEMGLSANGTKDELIERIAHTEVQYDINETIDEEELEELPMTSMPE